MEMNSISLPTTKGSSLPPDENAKGNQLITSQHWYSRLAIPWPLIYISHLAVALPLLILSIYFGVRAHSITKHPEPFWAIFPEFLAMILTVIITFFVQFVMLRSFWRARAREMVAAGGFDSNIRKGDQRLVLEIGCNEGSTSAIFARAIIDKQRDVSNLSGPSASLPTFIGFDKWSGWSRIPNNPSCYLATLLHAGVPRENIIANQVDNTSKETRTKLPYADNSITLIISNLGLSEIARWGNKDEREALFRELVRVLEPDGRMIVVEGGGNGWSTSHRGLGDIRSGPMAPYKRILENEMGWPKENAETKWHWGIHYLIGMKPEATKQTV